MPCCRLSGAGPPTGDEDEEEELDSVSFASASSSLSSAAGPLPRWLLLAALPSSCLARASAFCLAGGGLLTPGQLGSGHHSLLDSRSRPPACVAAAAPGSGFPHQFRAMTRTRKWVSCACGHNWTWQRQVEDRRRHSLCGLRPQLAEATAQTAVKQRRLGGEQPTCCVGGWPQQRQRQG